MGLTEKRMLTTECFLLLARQFLGAPDIRHQIATELGSLPEASRAVVGPVVGSQQRTKLVASMVPTTNFTPAVDTTLAPRRSADPQMLSVKFP